MHDPARQTELTLTTWGCIASQDTYSVCGREDGHVCSCLREQVCIEGIRLDHIHHQCVILVLLERSQVSSALSGCTTWRENKKHCQGCGMMLYTSAAQKVGGARIA
jgi:hypothetical protein